MPCGANRVTHNYKHFRTRPIWTRTALLNQFTPAQAREIQKYVHSPLHHPVCHTILRLVNISSKVLLPLTCYVFGDGPWRDTMVRFGYDPRQDAQARLSAYISSGFNCVDLVCQAIKNYISETSIIPLVVSPWYQGGGTVVLL